MTLPQTMATTPNKPPLDSRWTYAFYLALCCSLVLFVYRFFLFHANISLFRLVLVFWIALFSIHLVRGRVKLSGRHWAFVALLAALVLLNAIDFLTLVGHPNLRRDLLNHVANLSFAGLIALTIRSEDRLLMLLRTFVCSSLVTSLVEIYAAINKHLPLEFLIRRAGTSEARQLQYINDNLGFRRATSSFFDPNFYAYFSVLVIVTIIFLWLYDRPARWLAFFFPLNLVCLAFTLSRTGWIGLLCALAITGVLVVRARRFVFTAAAISMILFWLATAIQSHEYNQALRLEAQVLWNRIAAGLNPAQVSSSSLGRPPSSELARTPPAPKSADIPQVGQPGQNAELLGVIPTEKVVGRVTNKDSLVDRARYVRNGFSVFLRHPIFGAGSAGLLREDITRSSAHVVYLTLLARYGIAGALIYFIFMATPLIYVWVHRERISKRYRVLLSMVFCSSFVIYLSYDLFQFFEIQYLFYGIGYATILNRLGTPPSGITDG